MIGIPEFTYAPLISKVFKLYSYLLSLLCKIQLSFLSILPISIYKFSFLFVNEYSGFKGFTDLDDGLFFSLMSLVSKFKFLTNIYFSFAGHANSISSIQLVRFFSTILIFLLHYVP